MTMLERFTNSLVYPKRIIEYRKDKLIYVLLYLLFFIALMTTRTVIDVARFDGLTAEFRETFAQDAEIVDESCVIEDSMFSCGVEERTKLFENLALSGTNAIKIAFLAERFDCNFFDNVKFYLIMLYLLPIHVHGLLTNLFYCGIQHVIVLLLKEH